MSDPIRKPPASPPAEASTGNAGPARRLADVPTSGPSASRPIAGPPIGVRERRDRNVGWRSRDILRAAMLVFGLWVLAQLLWFANSLVFVVFLATLFGLAVAGAVDRLERFKIRRGVGSALVVFGSLAVIIGLGTWMAPTITDQIGVLRRQVPQAIDKLEERAARNPSGIPAYILRSITGTPQDSAAGAVAPAAPAGTVSVPGRPGVPAAATQPRVQVPAGDVATSPPDNAAAAPSATQSIQARLGGQIARGTRYLFPFLSSTLTVVGGLFLIIFLAIYIGAEPQLYHDGLMHLFPHRTRAKAGEVLTEMATVLRKWLVVQLVAMLVIGGVTTVAMLVLGVKAAFALGFIAGLLEFIPTVGPILAAVPAIAMGFVDSPEKALSVALVYWGIQFLENNLLIPQLMRGGMDIPPALTLVAQALMTLVFGFIGLMVAVPLTAAALVPVKMLYVRDVVGDEVDLMSDGDDDDD